MFEVQKITIKNNLSLFVRKKLDFRVERYVHARNKRALSTFEQICVLEASLSCTY